MNCYYHPDRAATQRCQKCGELLCQECAVFLDGRVVCKACLSKAVDFEPAPRKRPTSRNSNLLLVFLLAMCPGAAHMYMGLMKRGLLILSGFFLSIWALTIFTSFEPLFAFALVAICLSSFFDAFHTRKRIVMGECVEDSVADITGFVRRFRIPLSVLLILSVIANLFNAFSYRYYVPFGHSSFGNGMLVPIGIILFGLYVLFGGKKKRDRHDDTIDKRYDDNKYDQ